MPRSPDSVEVPGARGSQLDLSERLERLPHGHPSSPYEADGSRKPPVAAPRADDGPRDSSPHPEPFTDTEWAEHVTEVRDRLRQAHADGLATDEQYTIDPHHEVWSETREAQHDALIHDLYQRAAGVPCEYRAFIAGGLPGAGKTTVLENYAGIDRSQFLTINPDDVKAELVRRGLVPEVAGLSPMEASELVHEESSHIAKRLAFRAQADGKNVIWDVTMSSLASTQRRIEDLRENRYTQIEGIFVDLPPEVSADRAAGRHRDGEEGYRAGEGDGGRFLPAESILANTDPAWGSLNRKTFEQVKDSLDNWWVYDNSVDGRDPVLVESSATSK